MGLRDELTADIAEAFNTDLADAVTSFTAIRKTKVDYDPIEGTPVIPGEMSYTGRGVFGGYEAALVDGIQILATDTKLTALQTEVRDTPKIDDKINGLSVITIGQDPTGATWSLQLRKV